MHDMEKFTVSSKTSLREVMQVLDQTSVQIVLVVDDQKRLLGTCTDGDIRRALLAGAEMDGLVSDAMNADPIVVKDTESPDQIRAMMRRNGIRQVPIVDKDQHVDGLFLLADPRTGTRQRAQIVLMAGGLGKRLRPLTENCPKPMLSIGGKPLLEGIISRFRDQGFKDFFISVNFLGHMIEEHFGAGDQLDVNISYLREDKQLGTAGALALLPEDAADTLIVMNGDLITELDFRMLIDAHEESGAVATMCIREHRTSIAFGVVESDGHKYINTVEKPTIVNHINAGIYCISKSALTTIPSDSFYDMPTLFSDLVKSEQPCAVFKVRDLWYDIGNATEYEEAKRVFGD